MAVKKTKRDIKIFSDKLINKTIDKMNLLGSNYVGDPIKFLTVRVILTCAVFLAVLILSDRGYIYGPLSAIIFYNLYYYYFLTRRIKLRAKKLDYEALNFFEILTLTLESRRNLIGALEITVENIHSELSYEFEKTLYEIKFGKSLTEALDDMKKRIPSEVVNNIILNISQSNIFGNSVVETMYNQIDFLNDKRIMETREVMSKIPTKVSVISVVFYIPLMLLMLLGPLAIQYLLK